MIPLKDFGSLFAIETGAAGSAVAGGAGDNAAVTGETIDRDDFLSVVICLGGKATLAQAATLTMAMTLQESADGSTWDDAEDLFTATTVATGDTGGSTEHFAVKTQIDVSGRKRYIRVNITPNLSAANTDVVAWAAVAVKGGSFEIPQL